MAFSPFSCMTQAPSQSTSVGHTRPQLSPRMFASRITRAEPRKLPVVIFLMNAGTSMCVGHAFVHGASKQNRQRVASMTACRCIIGGVMSAKFFSYCSAGSFGAVSRRGIPVLVDSVENEWAGGNPGLALLPQKCATRRAGSAHRATKPSNGAILASGGQREVKNLSEGEKYTKKRARR